MEINNSLDSQNTYFSLESFYSLHSYLYEIFSSYKYYTTFVILIVIMIRVISNRVLNHGHYQFRNLSTNAKKISPNITFITNSPTADITVTKKLASFHLDIKDPRPLVIICCWLNAKNKPLSKYANLYLEKGFDVLTVNLRPTQILFAKQTINFIQTELLPLLETIGDQKKIFHGFSVGCYVLSKLFELSNQDPVKYSKLLNSINGQILDSFLDVGEAAIGLSNSIFPDAKLLQKIAEQLILVYLKLMKNISVRHYLDSRNYFFDHPLNVPSLFLCSKFDRISTLKVNMTLMNSWKEKGVDTKIKVWDNSLHVGHMYLYPEEYTATIESFIDQVGMGMTAQTARVEKKKNI